MLVNFFAGPGAGKSTIAAGVYSRLKFENISCEYIQEFAKDLIWENRIETLDDQWYVTTKQLHRISRVYKKVDIVITDSPILLGLMYYKGDNPHFISAFVWEHDCFNNLNFFINRQKPYHQLGRIQTYEQALEIDNKIKNLLLSVSSPFTEIDGNPESIEKAICTIKIKLASTA